MHNQIPRAPVSLSVRDLQSPFAGPFSFELDRGECLAIQGPSGVGKSVLLRMIADLDPHSGQAALHGTASTSMAAPVWRAKVVYQAAHPAWWEASVEQHFSPSHLEFIRAMLATLGLGAHVLTSDIARLSTGERQRLALLRSLAVGPEVLLLDEPTASLDPTSVTQVEDLLRSYMAQGLSLILVTHSAEQAQRLAHRILHIEKGRLTQS